MMHCEKGGREVAASQRLARCRKKIMAVLFSVSLPFFRFCSGNIAILLLLLMPPALLRFLFYNHKEIFISLQCCLCMFISRRPGMLCRPRGCTTSTAPLTAQDLRLLSLGGWERRSYSIIVVRYNIILSSFASKSLTSPLEYPITYQALHYCVLLFEPYHIQNNKIILIQVVQTNYEL